MAIKTYAQWPAGSTAIQYLAEKDVLETAPAYETLNIATDKKTMRREMGAAIVMRRWLTPAVDATPAPEGTQKSARTLVPEDFTGTMQRYTERIQVSRVDYDLSPWNAVQGAKDREKQLILSTRERIRFNAGISGTNVLYNSSAISTRATVNGPLAAGRLQIIIRNLENAKGFVFTDAMGATNKEGQSGIEPAFFAFCHSNLQPDIRALPGFQRCADYPGKEKHFREFGAWQNIRFFTTPEAVYFPGGGAASTSMLNTGGTAGNADVYPIIICGQHALTSVALTGAESEGSGNLKITILDQPDKYDANNNWVDIVSQWYDLCMVTSNDWLWRYEVATTLNP
jgi:N4-gp56 family major capsid protein